MTKCRSSLILCPHTTLKCCFTVLVCVRARIALWCPPENLSCQNGSALFLFSFSSFFLIICRSEEIFHEHDGDWNVCAVLLFVFCVFSTCACVFLILCRAEGLQPSNCWGKLKGRSLFKTLFKGLLGTLLSQIYPQNMWFCQQNT